jgi:hypothetical protein
VEATPAIAEENATVDSNKNEEVKSEIVDPIKNNLEEIDSEVTKEEESAPQIEDVESGIPDEKDKPEVPVKESSEDVKADESEKQKTDKEK